MPETDNTLNELTDNARKVLIESQLVCEETNKKISEFQSGLSNWEQDVSKLYFLNDCLENQYKLLTCEILDVGIDKSLIQKEWSDETLQALVSEMKYWQNVIAQEVTKLNETPHVLGGAQNNVEEKVLGDFIPIENKDILLKKLKDFPIIRIQIENIKLQYRNLRKKILEFGFLERIDNIRTELDTKLDSADPDVYMLTVEYPQTLKLKVENLADFITSLTSHYEKCQLLKGDKLDEQDFDELLTVIKGDDKNLNEVYLNLNQTVEESSDILRTSNILLTDKLNFKNEIHSEVTKLINEFKKHNESLLIFKNISDIITVFKNSCNESIEVVKQLVQFYKDFEKSYKNLIKEVDRRKLVSQNMKQIILNCENDLRKLNEEDQIERQVFLQNNGQFLPENIFPGNMDERGPMFTLQYTLNDI